MNKATCEPTLRVYTGGANGAYLGCAILDFGELWMRANIMADASAPMGKKVFWPSDHGRLVAAPHRKDREFWDSEILEEYDWRLRGGRYTDRDAEDSE